MQKIIFLVTILFISFSFNLFAQRPGGGQGKDMPKIGILSGTVLDAQGTPVEYATVSLFSMRDSKLVTGGITDAKGYFKIKEIKLGAYKAHIKFIGFNTKEIKPIYLMPKGRGKGQGTEQDLGKIKLNGSSVEIDDVNVVADKSHVQYKIDKKIVNVSQDINSAGGSAVDILENTPSVNVDIDGNVELRGSSNFTVLVDGKPTVLEASEVLQQIPANVIENIEIITNPSAKFDPDGAAGIINVIMKKKKLMGFNGVINLSAGTGDKYKGNVLLNYKTGKFNFTAGIDYRDEMRYGNGMQDRTINQSDTSYYMNYNGDRNMNIFGYGFQGGVDYYINDNNTLSISAKFDTREFSRNSYSYYHEWTSPSIIDDYYIRDNDLGYNGTSYKLDLDYSLKLKKPDQKLDVLLYYSNWEGKRFDDQFKYLTDSEGIIIDNNPEKRRSDQFNPREEFRYKFDFISPMGVNGLFEAGYHGRYEIKPSDYQYTNFNESTGEWEPDLEKSNSVEYTRNIQAVYSTYANKIASFEYKVGLRAEYTDRLLDQYTTGDKFLVNRFDFFPSAYLSKELNKKQQLQLSYSRRVNRPRTRSLNPFPDYSDPLNIRMGNPELEPEFVDSYEFNFQNRFKKSFVSVEAFYRRKNNLMTRVSKTGEDRVIYWTYDNLNHDNSLGIELMANIQFNKWWKLNGSSSAYHYSIIGKIDNEDISNESINWKLRLNNTFTFKSNTRIQLTGLYSGPSVTAQGSREAFYFASIAVRQDLLKKKLTITAQLRDIFNTMSHSFTSDTENFYTYSEFTGEGQVFMLSLTYRINNYKEKRNKGRNGGDDMEGIDLNQ
ncbi:MAG: TonB-dependent receptor [Bacteroidota bacterium]